MEKVIYEVEPGRWAYSVGSVVQEWHPEQPGYVAMTLAEAEQFADRTLEQLETPVVHRWVSKLELLGRFTETELSGIYEAEANDINIRKWLERFRMTSGDVDLNDARTVEGIGGLELLGKIAPGRASEILA